MCLTHTRNGATHAHKTHLRFSPAHPGMLNIIARTCSLHLHLQTGVGSPLVTWANCLNNFIPPKRPSRRRRGNIHGKPTLTGGRSTPTQKSWQRCHWESQSPGPRTSRDAQGGCGWDHPLIHHCAGAVAGGDQHYSKCKPYACSAHRDHCCVTNKQSGALRNGQGMWCGKLNVSDRKMQGPAPQIKTHPKCTTVTCPAWL